MSDATTPEDAASGAEPLTPEAPCRDSGTGCDGPVDRRSVIDTLRRRALNGARVTRLRRRYESQLAFLARRVERGTALGLSLTIGLLITAALAWLFADIAESVVAREEIVLADQSVARWVGDHRIDWLTSAMRMITTLGSAAFLIPLTVVIAALLSARRQWQPLVLLVGSYLGAVILFSGLKALIGRARPPGPLAVVVETGYAFPSGHTTAATVFYATLAFLLVREAPRLTHQLAASAGALLLAALVGASRVYLGVHWLSDVVAAFALGGLWVTVVITISTAVNVHRRSRHHDQGGPRGSNA